MAPFQETVRYKQVRESKDRKNKFKSEWKQGIWLGHAPCSDEIIIGTSSLVVRAFAIKCKDDLKHFIFVTRGRAEKESPWQNHN